LALALPDMVDDSTVSDTCSSFPLTASPGRYWRNVQRQRFTMAIVRYHTLSDLCVKRALQILSLKPLGRHPTTQPSHDRAAIQINGAFHGTQHVETHQTGRTIGAVTATI
jgi:hypothetical protein